METLRKIFRYLANLEWTERKQHDCIFCDRKKLQNTVYEVRVVFSTQKCR